MKPATRDRWQRRSRAPREPQREAERRRFVAEAGTVLMGAAPDHETTLAELGRLAVRELADWCLIDVIDEGEVRRLEVACSDPAKADIAEALQGIAVDRRRPHLMAEALQGRSVSYRDLGAEELTSFAQSSEHRELLHLLGARSMIVVPLVARGRLVGAMALISSRPDRCYEESDRRFAEQLAQVVGLAVDNARLVREAQRAIRARDEILGVIAHDLRNPLNAIMLQLQLMQRTGAEPERRRQRPIEVMRHAASRMNRLIEDMLDVGSLERGGLVMDREPVAIEALIDDVVAAHRALAAGAGIALRLEIERPLPGVVGDHARLGKALENLIGNAVKFTPKGGTIVVTAAARSGEILVSVADTGCGIPEDQLSRVFDRSWRGEPGGRSGLGFGLPIAKGIVVGHGGRIWVESPAGRGTAFHFTIPVAGTLRRPPQR